MSGQVQGAGASGLSDKAVAVFAFAAYHQLESGQPVTKVVRRDGAGHEADAEAVAELEGRGLVESRDNDIAFTPSGAAILAQAIAGLKEAASAA